MLANLWFPASLPPCPDGIVGYMRKQAGPSAKELQTLESVKKFLASTEHGVIGRLISLSLSHAHKLAHIHTSTLAHAYVHKMGTHTRQSIATMCIIALVVLIVLGFFTEEESKLRKAFTSVADTMRDSFRFAFSTAKEVIEEYKYSE